jgi:RNA polymerase sigma-70 factor (ECF subfamily)
MPSMGRAPQTRWSLIRKAAEGIEPDRDDFALLYEPAVRAYLGARWRGTPLLQDTDDAVQNVFLACFKERGALTNVEEGRPGGFRSYLYGVIRNTALLMERTWHRRRDKPWAVPVPPEDLGAQEDHLSGVFDREWARSILREAGIRQSELAGDKGEDAVRRVELLRLRFEEGLPIREIARRWDEEPARLHHEYARARKEYRQALLEVVGHHHPGGEDDVERESSRLLDYFAE